MFNNYIITAWRNLTSQKLFSLINIGGLSVAMTIVVLIMMWVQNELRFDNYHPAANRIYLVKNYDQVNKGYTRITENSPYLLKDALERELPEAELVTHAFRTQQNELTIQVNGEPFAEEWGIYIDENWFKVFHYEFVEGNPKAFFAHPYSLILTASKARKFFGKTNVAGRSLQIDSIAYTVQAVIEDNPVNSSLQFGLLMPMTAELNTEDRQHEVINWRYFTSKTFIRLQPGSDTAKVADKITEIYKTHQDKNNLKAILLPLKNLRFDTDFQWSAFKHVNIYTVHLFSLLAVLLLLTASINYVNLSVSRAGLRSKEISIRKVVGADRRQLFFQMIGESALTALLSLILTILLIEACLPFFNAFIGIDFRFNPLEPHLAVILFGILLSVVLLTGIYPALLLSSLKPASLFRGMSVFQLKEPVLRKGLVVVQFILAVIMTVAAVTIYRQLSFIQQQETGYKRTQVFTMETPVTNYLRATKGKGENWLSILRTIKQELLAQSSIKHVVQMTNNSVVNIQHVTSGDLDWEDRHTEFNPAYTPLVADADLNKIMNFQFVEGRWFDKNRTGDRFNVILNETAVREFRLKEPVIGRRFNQGRIIGVVEDFHYKSLRERIGPVVIHTELPAFANTLVVEIQPGKVAEALQAAKTIWHRQFPGEPFNFRFVDDEFDQLYRDDQKALIITIVFSGLSILISCLGLLGMIVFAAQRRNKEIGIRKVLGASVVGVVALLSKDFLKLVLIAMVVATPIAWYAMNQWLANFAYKIEIGLITFLIAGGLALAIVLLTVGWQSVRAALVNPVESLQSE